MSKLVRAEALAFHGYLDVEQVCIQYINRMSLILTISNTNTIFLSLKDISVNSLVVCNGLTGVVQNGLVVCTHGYKTLHQMIVAMHD